jgi:hypothetical protein
LAPGPCPAKSVGHHCEESRDKQHVDQNKADRSNLYDVHKSDATTGMTLGGISDAHFANRSRSRRRCHVNLMKSFAPIRSACNPQNVSIRQHKYGLRHGRNR